MTPDRQWTFAEWFHEAAHWYVEGHQACAWCGGSHRVFKAERDTRLEYYCNDCDFYVCHDRQADVYYMAPGQGPRLGHGERLADPAITP
jgi:hypothetical protein